MKREDEDVKMFLRTSYSFQILQAKPRLGSVQDIIDAIRNNRVFGLVQCDVHVPPHLRDVFTEMPPILKHADNSHQDIGDFMRMYAEDHGIMQQPRRSLIGSLQATHILLITSLGRWYLEHGLVITGV